MTALNFDMEANSTNPEQDTQYDNTMHMPIGVVIMAHLSVIGYVIKWFSYQHHSYMQIYACLDIISRVKCNSKLHSVAVPQNDFFAE